MSCYEKSSLIIFVIITSEADCR